MFFNIIHNSPFWLKLDKGKRYTRIMVAGMICYVLLHSFLYSKYAETKEKLVYYRNYLYYVFALDFFVLGIMYKMSDDDEITKQSLIANDLPANVPANIPTNHLPSNISNGLNSNKENKFNINVRPHPNILSFKEFNELINRKVPMEHILKLKLNNSKNLQNNNMQNNDLKNNNMQNNNMQNNDLQNNNLQKNQPLLDKPTYVSKPNMIEVDNTESSHTSINIPIYKSKKNNLDINIPIYKSMNA